MTTGELIFTKTEIGTINNYYGVCHNCNSPVQHYGQIVVVKIIEARDFIRVVPVDSLKCPYCGQAMATMLIYKSLLVSENAKAP